MLKKYAQHAKTGRINRYIVGCKSDYMEECRMVQAELIDT